MPAKRGPQTASADSGPRNFAEHDRAGNDRRSTAGAGRTAVGETSPRAETGKDLSGWKARVSNAVPRGRACSADREPPLHRRRRRLAQFVSASPAASRSVFDDMVGIAHTRERRALVPALPAGALAASPATALRRGLVVAVARGRAGAVAAVALEARLQLCHLGLQKPDLLEQLSDQRVLLRRGEAGEIERRGGHGRTLRPARSAVQRPVTPCRWDLSSHPSSLREIARCGSRDRTQR